MVKDIVRQLKLNPNQIPVPTTTHRRTGSGLEKVCAQAFLNSLVMTILNIGLIGINAISWQLTRLKVICTKFTAISTKIKNI